MSVQTHTPGEGIYSIEAKILMNQAEFIAAAGPILNSDVIKALALLANAPGYLKNDGAGILSWAAAAGGSGNSYMPSGW